ncbi:MAG: DUF2975 domain-containing protein [Bowdeniella nasicola]|nr:DUF2975 domain-containing protein [Bowdeniella nasicola]
MNARYVAPARIALVAVALGSVALQVLIPLVSFETGWLYPEVRHLSLPYAVAGVLAVAAAQVVLLAVWNLLSHVRRATLYTDAAAGWIPVMRAAVVVATLLPAAVCLHLLVVAQVGGPGVILFLFAVLALGAAAYLLLGVLGGVLSDARAEHDELAEVI